MDVEPRPADALANERTLLAYLRTGLSFIAFGFVVARFALFTREISSVLHLAEANRHVSAGFGTAIALFGAAVGLCGGVRYVLADRALVAGRVPRLPATVAIGGALVVTVIGAIVGASLLVLRD